MPECQEVQKAPKLGAMAILGSFHVAYGNTSRWLQSSLCEEVCCLLLTEGKTSRRQNRREPFEGSLESNEINCPRGVEEYAQCILYEYRVLHN